MIGETRNSQVQAQTSQEMKKANGLETNKSKNMNRAESVKNSRRYNKKKSTGNVKNQNTILSSYLPMKNYMVSKANNIKPIRQQIHREKSSLKAAVSDRNGLKTAKHGQRQKAGETFDQFVERMKKQSNRSADTYGFKPRPYTSSGYGQLRIKHQKRPTAKSGVGCKRYDEIKAGPYFQNKSYIPNKRKKGNTRQIGYKPTHLLNNSEAVEMDHRRTFYPTTSNSLANKTTLSNEHFAERKINNIQNTYGPKIGKLQLFKFPK